MKGVVLDASIALTWCYPDEHSDLAYQVLNALEHRPAIVPSIWAVEIANALIVGERRRRITAADTVNFIELLRGLRIETDSRSTSSAINDVLQVARTYDLSAYDAAYLELAMREGLKLATLDKRLQAAAEAAGLNVSA